MLFQSVSKKELQKVLERHQTWVESGRKEGERANLKEANLQWTFLENANLKEAILAKANLQKANLEHANLQKAKIWKANLRGASLKKTNFKENSTILFVFCIFFHAQKFFTI